MAAMYERIVVEGPLRTKADPVHDVKRAEATLVTKDRRYRVMVIIPGPFAPRFPAKTPDEVRQKVLGWLTLAELARCDPSQLPLGDLGEVRLNLLVFDPPSEWSGVEAEAYARSTLRDFDVTHYGMRWEAQRTGSPTPRAGPCGKGTGRDSSA